MFAEKKLRKHVSIIHAYSMMSALQRKIVNVLLYEAMKNKNTQSDPTFVECSMPFSTLINAVHFNSHNTQHLKESIDGLASLKIEWNLLKDKAPTNISFLNLRILHGSPTFYHNGSFDFSFHKVIFDLIGSPSIYGTIDLDLQSKFESKYSHALYENSTRLVNLQKNKVVQLDIARKLLGVNENKYKNMRELTRNVIKPAIEEVNDRADFTVNIENIKFGRKISGFELFVKNKQKVLTNNKLEAASNKNEIQKKMELSFGKMSEKTIGSILNNYSDEYILEKISYTLEHAKKDKNGLYPIPYFISALRDDYKSVDHEPKRQPLVEKSNAELVAWKEQLVQLEADLNHWQEHLSSEQVINNSSLAKNTKKIISQCKNRLENHLSKKSLPILKKWA